VPGQTALHITIYIARYRTGEDSDRSSSYQHRIRATDKTLTFGERVNLGVGGVPSPDPNRQDPTFHGRPFDPGLGVYNYRNRLYDPRTGRFLQNDTYLDGANLLNPYAAMANNPVRFVDPMGTFTYDPKSGYEWDDFFAVKPGEWAEKKMRARIYSSSADIDEIIKDARDFKLLVRGRSGGWEPKLIFGRKYGRKRRFLKLSREHDQLLYYNIGSKLSAYAGWRVAGGRRGPYGSMTKPIPRDWNQNRMMYALMPNGKQRMLDDMTRHTAVVLANVAGVVAFMQAPSFGNGPSFRMPNRYARAQWRYFNTRNPFVNMGRRLKRLTTGRWKRVPGTEAKKLRTPSRGPGANGGKCFVAGTLVHTAAGTKKIEEVRVGQRVLTTDGDETAGEEDEYDPDLRVEPDQRSWRKIAVRMPDPNGSDYPVDIVALRPLTWLEKTGAEPGKWIHFSLAEMQVSGYALVTAVESCPKIEKGPGRVVLATITSVSNHVLKMRLEGQEEPLEPTALHRFYFEDRREWISAGLLRNGERIRTREGSVRFKGADRKPGATRVYNLEVQTKHCYYVAAQCVLSHNVGSCTPRILGGDVAASNIERVTEWRRTIHRSKYRAEMEKFLGDKYVKVGQGKWRNVQGTRQFRLKPNDYFGRHKIGPPGGHQAKTPHVHFEFLKDAAGGGFEVTKSIHVPLTY